nr:ribosomal protein L34 [Rhodochorton tenue]WOK79373.1 ribosomal protein L34 [Rhodochorton tenue]
MTKGTLRGTNRKRIKTSGFRTRMQTPSGKRIIKARRRKNKKQIAI